MDNKYTLIYAATNILGESRRQVGKTTLAHILTTYYLEQNEDVVIDDEGNFEKRGSDIKKYRGVNYHFILIAADKSSAYKKLRFYTDILGAAESIQTIEIDATGGKQEYENKLYQQIVKT